MRRSFTVRRSPSMATVDRNDRRVAASEGPDEPGVWDSSSGHRLCTCAGQGENVHDERVATTIAKDAWPSLAIWQRKENRNAQEKQSSAWSRCLCRSSSTTRPAAGPRNSTLRDDREAPERLERKRLRRERGEPEPDARGHDHSSRHVQEA